MVCPCGVDAAQPWRERDNMWSPASFVGGLVLINAGIAACS
jgi:hypothetical protein